MVSSILYFYVFFMRLVYVVFKVTQKKSVTGPLTGKTTAFRFPVFFPTGLFRAYPIYPTPLHLF